MLMRKRPWTLIVLAVLHVFAPFGNIIFNALITGQSVEFYMRRSLSLDYLQANWVIVLAPIIAGVAIYACKKWSFYVYLLSIVALFIASYQGYLSKAGSLGLAPVIFVYLINILVVVYFLIPAVRNIYFDKRMRWWEVKPRYKCDYTAQWKFEDDEVVHAGHINNFSVNGLFLKSDIIPRDEDLIEITVPFDGGVKAHLTGRVVFHSRAKSIGFGVQFEHDKESKKITAAVSQDLERQGMRIDRLEVRPEDSFCYLVRTLVTTGKGFVPKQDSRS